MSLGNDRTRLLIPQRHEQKRDDDEAADYGRSDCEPGQERFHWVTGRNGRRFATSVTVKAPKAKPPMCAKNATPPPVCGCSTENPPSQSWKMNQMPRNR